MGKASPNHNLTKHTLELAGQGVIHLLRAIKHGGKASELARLCLAQAWVQVGVRAPGCALSAKWVQREVLGLCTPPGPQ